LEVLSNGNKGKGAEGVFVRRQPLDKELFNAFKVRVSLFYITAMNEPKAKIVSF